MVSCLPHSRNRRIESPLFVDDHIGSAPTAAAGTDQVVDSGNTVVLDASSSVDVGAGVIATYTWRQTSGSALELVADGATVEFTAPAQAGALEFELSVTDDRGNVATDSVVITVVFDGGPTGGDETPGSGTGSPNPEADGRTPAELVGGCDAGNHGSPASLVLLLGALAFAATRRRNHRMSPTRFRHNARRSR